MGKVFFKKKGASRSVRADLIKKDSGGKAVIFSKGQFLRVPKKSIILIKRKKRK